MLESPQVLVNFFIKIFYKIKKNYKKKTGLCWIEDGKKKTYQQEPLKNSNNQAKNGIRIISRAGEYEESWSHGVAHWRISSMLKRETSIEKSNKQDLQGYTARIQRQKKKRKKSQKKFKEFMIAHKYLTTSTRSLWLAKKAVYFLYFRG